MKSTITKQGKNERLIEVEMSDQELEPHFDTVYRKYQKSVRLEGFRKGRVPRSLVKKLYGEAMKEEAIEQVVQSVFREVSVKENLRPVGPAKLEDVNYDPADGLRFKALVEVYPEVEIKTYRGLSVEREDYIVGEEDVNAALEDVREQMAVMEPVESAAEEGHFILADFQQIDISGAPLIGKKFENSFFELNLSGRNIELSRQLIGVQPGETRRIELKPMVETADAQEAQTSEFFEVKVKEIKSKQVPEIDDDLAKDTGKFETLDELKSDIRAKLTKQTQRNSDRALRNRLIDELLKKNEIELPTSMIDSYLDAIVEAASKDESGEVDEEAVRQEYRPNAIWNLKWELAKEKIAELEEIDVSDDDRKTFLSRFAEENGVDEKTYRKSVKTQRARNRFDDDILTAKVLDLLQENAKLKERKVTWKDLQKARELSLDP